MALGTLAAIMHLITGDHPPYRWIDVLGPTLPELVSAVPQLVKGQRVGITSFDSGPLQPTAEELASGWVVIDSVALSPVVEDLEQLPTAGYDEWYVGAGWANGSNPHVFVNTGFSLRDPEWLVNELQPTWDRASAEATRDSIAELQQRFWAQLAQLKPITYLAEGDRLICATCDHRLFTACEDWLRRKAKPSSRGATV